MATTKEFKYIDNDKYMDFAVGMGDKVEELLNDRIILDFFKRQGEGVGERPTGELLELAESFLHLMIDHEEYEICQTIVNNYPELRINC